MEYYAERSFDISSSIISLIFAKIVAIRNILSRDITMPAEIPKFSNAHFRNIPENLSHIFDAFSAEMEDLCLHRENYGKIIGISRGNSWWRQGLTRFGVIHLVQ